MSSNWEVEYSEEFEYWWSTLTEVEQDGIDRIVLMLEQLGPALPFPYCSGINGSRHKHMRELRIQIKGNPYRILYAFDPRRVAVLLIGGTKVGKDRWYKVFVPKADRIYDLYLRAQNKEKL